MIFDIIYEDATHFNNGIALVEKKNDDNNISRIINLKKEVYILANLRIIGYSLNMSKLINKLFAYNDPGSLVNAFRNKRFKFFECLLNTLKQDNIRILDIGGTESYWVNRNFHNRKNAEVTLLNLQPVDCHYPNFRSVTGDAVDLSRFRENEFDIVFSNSVIEHLYTFENQVLMAQEMQRVGKCYYIQTPNKYFFIEPHFRFPFFQFLPNSLKLFILTQTKLIFGRKWEPAYADYYISHLRLLSLKEFKILFPGGKIYCERFLGFLKSFCVYSFEEKGMNGW